MPVVGTHLARMSMALPPRIVGVAWAIATSMMLSPLSGAHTT